MISTLELLEAYEQAEREYMYTEGKAEGKAEGIAEGRIEGGKYRALETAKIMLADGVKPDVTAKYTGLSLSQIQSLLHQ